MLRMCVCVWKMMSVHLAIELYVLWTLIQILKTLKVELSVM